MTQAERNREAALYSELGGIPLSETRPPTSAERKRIGRLLKPAPLRTDSRKSALPSKHVNARRLGVLVERRLISRLDAFAKANNMSRSEIIARSLETMLARAG